MKKHFDIIKFITQLLSFSPRQGENEKKAAKFILSILDKHQIAYTLQGFTTTIPLFEKAKLVVDGEEILCKGSSLVSGEINDKEHIVSSLIFSDAFIDKPNINFNPKSDYISLASMYFAPAVAVDKNNLAKVLKAKNVKGEVRVKLYEHQSLNILVGNTASPKVITFAHYDSIAMGATDNASGVGVMMKAILSSPSSLKDNLYIFSGNEEFSFDKPAYWGHGYRAFEEGHRKILDACKKIFVIDSVGNGKTNIDQDKTKMHLAFPLKSSKKWQNKTFLYYGDIEKLMSVYHSEGDTIDQLQKDYLEEAVLLLAKNMSRLS